jgi:hypothetical protein
MNAPTLSRRDLLRLASAATLVSGLPSLAIAATSGAPADAIYLGGDIITMAGRSPAYAEAVAVRNGRILFVGSLRRARQFQGPATRMVDLLGATMLPGFIDPHSHVMMCATQLDWANLYAPPMGTVTRLQDIVDALRAKQRQAPSTDAWLFGVGYDPDLLDVKRHPTAADLDAAFPDTPVIVMHVSGHMAVANSAAMRAKGITDATPDPAGGMIVRVPGTRQPQGLFQENAMGIFLKELQPALPDDVLARRLSDVLKNYASRGLTTAQEGGMLPGQLAAMRYAAANDMLPIDLVAIPFYRFAEGILADPGVKWGVYEGRLKLGGLKLTLDGSPQGKTAFLTKPYLTPVPGCDRDCRSAPTMSQEAVDAACLRAYRAGIQVYAHCNGDGAIDMMIRAHERGLDVLGQRRSGKNRRTVVVHSQIMRPDQIDAYARTGLLPTFFTNHTYYWGDTHAANLGSDRADFISPMRAAIDRGILPTNHSDCPVTAVDPLFTVWSAVNRVSRSGAVIGAAQRITPYEALQAITANAARQYFEEERKGTLAEGKLADLVVLDGNPLKVRAADIKGLAVLATYKEGREVYSRSAA